MLHLYYGMTYIKHHWGGAKEQEEPIAQGVWDAKNWQDEAMKILEAAVSHICLLFQWIEYTNYFV